VRTADNELIALENKFWQSIVDEDADAAVSMLEEPAFMVSSHGTLKFDHEGYRKMAKQGTMIVKEFELSDMNVVFPKDDTAVLTYRAKQVLTQRGKKEEIRQEMADSSVWTRRGGQWRCVMHTETPVTNNKA
jgi:hypothetical protein